MMSSRAHATRCWPSRQLRAGVLLGLLAALGCGDSASTPDPTPTAAPTDTRTPRPTETSTHSPSFTPSRTATITPTPTVVTNRPIFAAVGHLNDDDLPDIATANQGSDNVSVLLQQPDHTFAPASGSPFAVATEVNAVFVLLLADVNGDARADLVGTSGNYVNVLLRQAAQGFAPAPGSPFVVGAPEEAIIAIGDLDADGLPDVVTSAVGSDALGVSYGGPGWSFAAAPGSPYDLGIRCAQAGGPFAVAIADVNADGRADLISPNGYYSGSVSVLLAAADRSFHPAPGSPFSLGALCMGGLGPVGVAAVDVDGDAHLDLVTANGDGGRRIIGGDGFELGSVTVLRGQSDGTFALAPGSPFSVGAARPVAIAAADLNGDGTADIVTANFGPYAVDGRPRVSTDPVSVLFGDPSAGLLPAPGSPYDMAAGNAIHVVIADLNRDEHPDVVAVHQNRGAVSVLLGGPERAFLPASGSPFCVGPPPFYIRCP